MLQNPVFGTAVAIYAAGNLIWALLHFRTRGAYAGAVEDALSIAFFCGALAVCILSENLAKVHALPQLAVIVSIPAGMYFSYRGRAAKGTTDK